MSGAGGEEVVATRRLRVVGIEALRATRPRDLRGGATGDEGIRQAGHEVSPEETTRISGPSKSKHVGRRFGVQNSTRCGDATPRVSASELGYLV